MLKNYIKIAFRNLIKNKSHTIINVGGLTLGIVCALVIFLVIQFDLSFDTWHQDRDQIYRVVTIDTEFGNTDYSPGGPYPRAKAIREDVAGVEAVTIINDNYSNTPVIFYSEEGKIQKKFKDDHIAFVDQEYFEIFTHEWLAGNRENALEPPNMAVITEGLATKLFGSSDVLGKQLSINLGDIVDVQITGLVKEMPDNSDFPFTLLISSHSTSRQGFSYENDEWGSSSSSLQTYVKLEPGVNPETVNAQFDPMITKYRNEERAEVLDFALQPLSEIHFDSRYGNYNDRVIEKEILFTLGIIGLLLLLTACINFINLNTAIAVKRSKEVGLRKTLGGTRLQLTLHFLGETAVVTFLSILLGIGITEIILPAVEPLLGFTPELNLFNNLPAALFLLVLFTGITLTAGWYPAQHLSGFSPIEAIRNNINASYGRGLLLRRSLIIFQFTVTQILIIGTFIIGSQIRFFQNQELGYDEEALVEVELPRNDKQTLDTFKNLLLNSSHIQSVSFSNTGTTSNSTWSGNYLLIDDSVRKENNAQIKFVDQDFVKTYDLQLLAGQNLAPSDTVTMFLVNEAFAKQVGYGDNYAGLIGKTNIFWGSEAPITGVVKDFNTQSLHAELQPVLLASRDSYYIGAIKINSGQTQNALASIREAYNQVFPNFVFDYYFLDEKIGEMYEGEQRTARIMNAFTIIAILIGSLGLFGLVSYMASTRTKEIGVRKVLGASILDILKIFGKELAILTGIAFVLAAPVAWYLMQQWLADFAYKIEPGIGVFAAALAGTILLALITVGYKSIRAALANPVDSLKSE